MSRRAGGSPAPGPEPSHAGRARAAGSPAPGGEPRPGGGAQPRPGGAESPPGGGKPKLAVWKFASCDGCQLTLLDCEPALLPLAEELEIAFFLEASSAPVAGPYDLSIIEGSITTPHDAERIQQIRASSRRLVAIGACATAGGIQALRNFTEVDAFLKVVYASPEYITTLQDSTPASGHVAVDLELQGCPPNPDQLLEVIRAFLQDRKPPIAHHSVCMECKRRGNVCVLVAHGTNCLGPVTHAGCGALCPTYHRGCYGCYGPMETPNTASLTGWLADHGTGQPKLLRLYRLFYANAPAFRAESEAHES